MNLLEVFSEPYLLVDLEARDKKGAIKEIVRCLVDGGAVDDEVGKKIEKAVNKRESEGSTGIGKGLAIPHAKECPAVDSMIGIVARSAEGIEYNSIDGSPVHVLFLVVSPENCGDQHMAVMKRIAAMHRDEKNIKFFTTTDRLDSVREIFREVDETFA